jgi:multidrug efflux pump subunit AcrA (membrane-fusion protein)
VLRVELLDDGVVVVLEDDKLPSVWEESRVPMVPRSARHATAGWRRRPGRPRSFRARMTVAVVAACLVLATSFTAPVRPSAPVGQVIEVKVGSVAQTVVLTGVIEHEPDLPVRSMVSGTVSSVTVRTGDGVSGGEPILSIVSSPSPVPSPTLPQTPPPSPPASPTALAELSPTPTPVEQPAPIDGTVNRVDVAGGEQVTAGEQLLTITPNRSDVVAPVPVPELARFYKPPVAISATVPNGPLPFTCTFLSIGQNLPAADASRILRLPVDLRCRVPANLPVFPGVRARVVVTTDVAIGVPVVPVQAVAHRAGTDYVWVVRKSQPPVRRLVSLGISDGTLVQIMGGLSPGERVELSGPFPIPSPRPGEPS